MPEKKLKQLIQEKLSKYPLAQQPVHNLGGVNSSILLYQGKLEICQGPKTFSGEGEIKWEWLPYPQITFHLSVNTDVLPPELEDAILRLEGGIEIQSATITNFTHNMGMKENPLPLRGKIFDHVENIAGKSLSEVSFYLPNFSYLIGTPIKKASLKTWAGRNEFCGDGWQIIIDEIEKQNDIENTLKNNSGFAITHIGRLQRMGGEKFSSADAAALLKSLWWLFSISQGRWTGPILPVGFDESGNEKWKEWNAKRITPWRFVFNWLDPHHSQSLAELFPKFLHRWQDPNWQETIRLAIHWYIEANLQSGAIEGALIFLQAAFELLSWTVLVEDQKAFSANKFDDLNAAEKIRKLIEWAGLPLSIPNCLKELSSLATSKGWNDTPEALTKIRNPLIHPSRKNRERFEDYPPNARTEAWHLGMWYLEMLILRVLDYQGVYANRLECRYVGEVEDVPWAANP